MKEVRWFEIEELSSNEFFLELVTIVTNLVLVVFIILRFTLDVIKILL